MPCNFLLKAKHDIWNKKNCVKLTFSDIGSRRGRASILKSFHKPIPLGYDLYKCFSVPHSSGETRRLEGNGNGYFPSPRSVRLSKKSSMLNLCTIIYFEGSLIKNRMLRACFEIATFPPSLPKVGDFSPLFSVRTW